MKHLLDVNVLLAGVWTSHPQHPVAFTWLVGKKVVVCPLGELGFLRISTHKKTFNVPMEKARELLCLTCSGLRFDEFLSPFLKWLKPLSQWGKSVSACVIL